MESNKNGMIAAVVALLVLVGGGALIYSATQDDDEVATSTTPETSQSANQPDPQPEVEEAAPTQDIVELAQATPTLSTLVDAVVAAELVETLSGDGPFTVFAPTNDAFAALPEGTLATLLEPENKDQLAGILTFHVVPSKAMAGDLTDGMTVTTVQGEQLTIGVTDAGVTVNGANVVLADVEATNGVVHVIDSVLLPEN